MAETIPSSNQQKEPPMKYTQHLIAFSMTFLLLVVGGCGKKPAKPQAEMDTPSHHVSNGHKLLHMGQTDEALREFERARDLDPKFARAYIGMGIALGMKNEYENQTKIALSQEPMKSFIYKNDDVQVRKILKRLIEKYKLA